MSGDQSPTCPVCGSVFGSYQGRRVHERRKHPEEYHGQEVEALDGASRKVRWDQEELFLMATYEAQHPRARFINKEIRGNVLPSRTIEAIKKARRTQMYQALLRETSLRPQGETSGVVSSSPTPPTVTSGSPLPTTSGQGASAEQPRSQYMPEDELCIHVQALSSSLGLTIPSSVGEVDSKCLTSLT